MQIVLPVSNLTPPSPPRPAGISPCSRSPRASRPGTPCAGGGLVKRQAFLGSGKGTLQRGAESFTASDTQQAEFTALFIKAMVTGNVPFNFIENPSLIKACKLIGIDLPSCQSLTRTHLPNLAKEPHVLSNPGQL